MTYDPMSDPAVPQIAKDVLRDCRDEITKLAAENDLLRARNGRLRKAVNWLRGANHDAGSEPVEHHGTVDECEVWECMRARVVLAEDRSSA